VREMLRIAGGIPAYPSQAVDSKIPSTRAPKYKTSPKDLPTQFDWRDINGVNYVSPVRNQGGCGSCYAFGTTAMLEARTLIMSNKTNQMIFSPQRVVSCSEYSQACEGGFPYLIGKFGEDFYMVDEACFPYTGSEQSCSNQCTNPKQVKTTNYYYVGGYYGACTEELMRQEIFENGPIAISFEVYSDFFGYKGGIYVHQNGTSEEEEVTINPWQITNHVVLIVGWGVSNDSVPYWSVKNSVSR